MNMVKQLKEVRAVLKRVSLAENRITFGITILSSFLYVSQISFCFASAVGNVDDLNTGIELASKFLK